MRFAVAAFVGLVALAHPAVGDPVPYLTVLANEREAERIAAEAGAAIVAEAVAEVSPDATGGLLDRTTPATNPLMQGDPDWRASARLYHAGGGGATGNDSLGCRPIAMRTVATDPRIIPRRTRLFIRETVGLELGDGTTHDGYWYASDTGGAIRGNKVDLYTGHGRASMRPIRRLNMRTLNIADAGTFTGCPPDWDD